MNDVVAEAADHPGPSAADRRPEDCDCGDWNADAGISCWPCFRGGFDDPADAENSDPDQETAVPDPSGHPFDQGGDADR